MGEFDDYVAQQAAQRKLDQADAADRRKASGEEVLEARRKSLEFFQKEVMGPFYSAAKSLSTHVDTTASSETALGATIGYLRIGGPQAPRKVELSVRQNGAVYVLAVKGAGRGKQSEQTVSENDLVSSLKLAIVDAADRWFATNDHRGT